MPPTLCDIIYQLPPEPKPICWAELFGNDHPVELEIGTGKGGFLLEQARRHGDRNFLGVEWANKYFKFAADRMARWGLTNVRLVRCDAKDLVIRCLPEASVSVLHVYHPDPWPKKRHGKRRLFDPALVAAATRALADGGTWEVQTDHRDYFELIQNLLVSRPELEQTLRDPHNEHAGDATVATNFEIKYRREGREIYRLTCVRRPRN